MSIDCSDQIQFPPLSSQKTKTNVNNHDVLGPSVVLGGPDGDGQKTVEVHQLVGIPPYDLAAPDDSSEWRVQSKRRGKQPLRTIPEENEELLQFSDDDVKEELEYWKNSVYGFVLGANPPVDVVEGFLKRLWAKFPIDKISFCSNGVFIVRFKTSAARTQILQQGHFLFDNKPLIVRPWSEGVALEKEVIKEVPVWVKVHNLPLKFWGKCLPKIAGIMGTFVRCDDATKEKTRLGFARVMIDVPFGKPIPEKIKFLDVDGSVICLKVEFEWKPLLCTQCNGIGHDTSKCRKGKTDAPQKKVVQPVGKQQWRPKQKKPVAAPPVVTPPAAEPTAPVSTPVEIPNNFEVNWTRDGKYHVVDTPARRIIRYSRQEMVKTGLQAIQFGKHNFMESINNVTPKVGVGTNGSALSPMGDNIGLFGLLETKVKPLSLNSVRNNLCSSWCLTTNTQCHKGGRVWLLWNPAMFRVHILEYNAQFIHLQATDMGTNTHFHLTMVYAFNGLHERKELWSKLSQFKDYIQGAWAICGDFNTVLSPNERLGGASSEEEITDFKNCIDDCEVMDCPATGSLFTWCNKHEPATRVYSRLDRVLVNQKWLQDYPQAYAFFYCEGIFNHCPCVVQSKLVGGKKKRSFKYFNMWSKSVDFQKCVKTVWDQNWPGTKMYKLVCKLKHLKGPLKNLNKNDFVDVENNYARAQMYLEKVQLSLRTDPLNPDLIVQEREAASSVRFLNEACYV
ncbi:uncharacterized protein LOC141588331 [Silene latifolia]|uniref:uncharacterized protein LOC141588331 n=1 Tax=Silene latifolia TaxID=37657 RepID=UPI003D780B52